MRPSFLPKPIKVIILLTGGLSLLSSIMMSMGHLFPQLLLTLSTWGMQHFFLWQLVTYIFVQPVPLSLTFFINLFFSLYLIWMIGSAIFTSRGARSFYILYFGGTLAAGLAAYAFLPHGQIFAGNGAPLFALLLAWVFLFPEIRIYVFLTFPVKAKYLVGGYLGIRFLLDLTQGQFFSCAAYLASALVGYLYALLFWEIQSPYAFMHPFEGILLRTKTLVKNSFQSEGNSSKIFDFKTGKPVFNDEAFMDDCLAKISREGKGSLTFMEKWRMKRIAKRRSR